MTSRHETRAKLAEMLREPVGRVMEMTRLNRFGRYDPAKARELLDLLGVEVSEEQIGRLERVKDLLDLVGDHARPPRIPSAARPAAAAEPEAAAPVPAKVRPAVAGTHGSPLPYVAERTPAAAVFCSDGRLGGHVDDLVHGRLGLPRCDRITCPGGPVALTGRLQAFWECRGVEDQLRYLVRAHGLRKVVLVAHEGCGYYRDRLRIAPEATEAVQRADLQQAAWAVGRIEPVEVAAFFLAFQDGRVLFEPVTLT